MTPLRDKVALVTGAGGMKGVGRAIALELCRQGATIALTDVARNEDYAPPEELAAGWRGIDSVAEEVRALGGRVGCFICDLTDRAGMEAMVEAVHGEFGRIDILVNNARAIIGRDRAPVTELDAEVWDTFMAINTTAPFLLTKFAARKMIAGGEGGRVINIGSDLSKQARKFGTAYAASKFGLIGLTQGAALDLAEHGITVNAVCPGSVDTDRLSYAERAMAETEGVSLEVIRERWIKNASALAPLGRIAQPEDVAGLVGFLAGPQGSFITGQAYNVNGGQLFH